MHAILAVHRPSYPFIENVSKFIFRAIKQGLGSCDLIQIDTMEDVGDAGIVFVIGEHLNRFERRPNVRYVYLNFSVVTVLGNPLRTNPSGWAEARRKRELLAGKIDLFDVLLDYYPPQVDHLSRRLPVPVHHFPVAVDPLEQTDTHEFDVCFTGVENERRRAILDGIRALGWNVAPTSGVAHEDIAARSRLCLNIHKLRSNHLETPRIVGALAAGAPVVTEFCYGLETLVPGNLVVSVPYARLVRAVDEMLRDPARLEALKDRSSSWYREIYLPSCEESWTNLCRSVREGQNITSLKPSARFRTPGRKAPAGGG